MMAPTEILARQHYASLCEYLAPLGIEVGLLIGSTKKKERTRLLADLSTGALKIIVGTHALLEPVVQFAHLGLAVIDEQHRFGVVQRSGLWQKGEQIHPHILIMSATPIPRTLAMTLYGDLDISVIDELPPRAQAYPRPTTRVRARCIGYISSSSVSWRRAVRPMSSSL